MKPGKSKDPKKPRAIRKRLVRLAITLLVLGISSVFFQFVIEAPINLPDSFLALPVLCLWQPLFGLPLIIFSEISMSQIIEGTRPFARACDN
jgi:hypothetical protein